MPLAYGLQAMVWRYAALALVLFMFQGSFAAAETSYYALGAAAIKVKLPSATPLVTVTRAGQWLYAGGLHGVIIVSKDNGLSWQQAAVPVDLTITDIYFESPQEGWAVGHYGVILHTADSGLTWTKSLDGLTVIDALDAAATQAKAVLPPPPDLVTKVRVATAFDKAGPSKPFLTVGACGSGILAAGQQDMAMYKVAGHGAWQQWTSQIGNPTFLNIYASMDEGSATFLVTEQGMVLKGDADCLNFKSLPGPYTATLFGGLVLGPQKILVYGMQGGLFESTDDGATWKTFATPSDAIFVTGVVLKSGQALLATLGGTLYLSDPTGGHFRPLSVSEPFEIADLVQADNGNIVIVGNAGVAVLPLQSLQ